MRACRLRADLAVWVAAPSYFFWKLPHVEFQRVWPPDFLHLPSTPCGQCVMAQGAQSSRRFSLPTSHLYTYIP